METQTILNTFAKDVFLTEADCDYVSARMNFKMGLRQQFLWSAEQAVEKYLKAILLFNGISARYYSVEGKNKPKEFQHDLEALVKEVAKIEYLQFDLPIWGMSYIRYLQELGGYNRYLSQSSYTQPDFLHKLDEIVWSIRRYCRYIPDRGLGCNQEVSGMKQAFINEMNHQKYKDKPMSYSLVSGELEKIMALKPSNPTRKALIWANLFFGKSHRKTVKFKSFSSSVIPPQHRHWFEKETTKEIISKYIKL